jgi:hypothetical protein
VQVPVADGLLIVMDRAAMVVLDFLAGVPVTVTQSPAATALMVSVAVALKVVVVVQLTDVCAVVLCTSMDVPLIDATLPLAPVPPGPGAAPATDDSPSTMATDRNAAPASPARCPIIRLPRDALTMMLMHSFFVVRATYSLLSASMGARLAARLAG